MIFQVVKCLKAGRERMAPRVCEAGTISTERLAAVVARGRIHRGVSFRRRRTKEDTPFQIVALSA